MSLIDYPDMIRHLATFLLPIDVLHVGMTCSKLSRYVLDNAKLWRYYVVQRFPRVPTQSIGDYDISWKALAFSKAESLVKKRLQIYYLQKRLNADQRNPDFLRFYCKINTATKEGKLKNEIILTGNQADDDSDHHNAADNIKLIFRSKNPSFLYWQGENDIQSSIIMYAVDRKKLGVMTPIESLRTSSKQTILSKTQYKEIGRIAHEDENFYGGEVCRTYNYDTGHSRFRNMGSQNGFASSTSSYEAPLVRVSCYTEFSCLFDLDTLYVNFVHSPF